MSAPLPPSARKAPPPRIARDETRLVIEVDASERRAIKVRAAQLGITVKAYLLGLAALHGCPDLPPVPVALMEPDSPAR